MPVDSFTEKECRYLSALLEMCAKKELDGWENRNRGIIWNI